MPRVQLAANKQKDVRAYEGRRQVLGEQERVVALGNFYDEQKESLDLVYWHLMIEYVEKGGHDKEDIDSFVAGMKSFMQFFQNCHGDVERLKADRAE